MAEDNKKGGEKERQMVIFTLGAEEFGVDIGEVREIIRMEPITKIPHTPPYILGVINLRGGIIVVVDLGLKLSIEHRREDKNTRIIVIQAGGMTIGMVVDSATEVLRIRESQIQPAPAIITEKIQGDYIEGVGVLGERLLILLDLRKVLETREIEELKKTAPK
jgi:purine-binding chemotaxis protein CheW